MYQFILTCAGVPLDNLLDKIIRIPAPYQAEFLARLLYIDAGAKDYIVPSPLYYRLDTLEPFFESANRLPSIFKRQDPDLQSAPILGWNIIPWMVIYVLGYFYIAGLNLVQHMPDPESKVSKSFAGSD